MTTTLRKSDERGHADHGWLDTYHTFSFASYLDPRHMGFRALRVINEDRVQPGQGFGTHGHQDMEILTVVLSGALEHKDSLGTGSVIRPGDVQRMSAGRGVLHSEFNPSRDEPVHLLQIWILPEERGIDPSYEQKAFVPEGRRDRLRLLASQDGRDGALTIHQDAALYDLTLSEGRTVEHTLGARHAWIQVTRGRVRVGGEALGPGDGLAVSEAPTLAIEGLEPESDLLLFDLA